MHEIAVLKKIGKLLKAKTTRDAPRVRLLGVLILLGLATPLWSQSFLVCEQAITALEQQQVDQARLLFRAYVGDSQDQQAQDPRCGAPFVARLSSAFIESLSNDINGRCQSLLTASKPATAGQLAALNAQIVRLDAYDGTLTTEAAQCQQSLSSRYEGIDWLKKHRPRLVAVHNNCLTAEALLDPPVSLVDIEQAGAIIRSTWVEFWLEQAMLDDGPMSTENRALFNQSVQLAESCLIQVENAWAIESRRNP